MKLSAILTTALVSASACTFDKCKNVDEGSCGTACCKLNFYLEGETTTEVMNKLNSTLGASGPDGLYIPMPTAEGTMTFGDLRPYDKPVDFIGQAWHTTANLMYNDTLNFLVAAVDEGKSTQVTGFSISQLGGSYGDEGQNYYNLVQLMDSVSWKKQYEMEHADSSCPEPN